VSTAAPPLANTGMQYYGWQAIVPAAFVILLITNGLTVGGIAAFDPSLIRELGVQRADIKLGDAIQLALTAVLTLLTGKIADRHGVRVVMLAGVLSLAWGFYSLGQVETLSDYYWSRMWMGLGLAGAGLAITVVAVSRWFLRSRGLALGIVLAGTSLGNGFLPSIFTHFIAELGWQRASLVAVAMLAILPSIIWLAVREWPRDRGLKPYGADKPAAEAQAMGEELSYLDILRRKEFWLMAIAAFGTFYSILGVNNNMILHMQQLGQSAAAGAAMAIPLFIAGLTGKLLSGWLSDIVGRKAVWIGSLALMFVGAALLASMQVGLIAVASVVLGLGWGANYTLLQAVAGDLFGARSLGRVMGAVTVLDAGGGALGPWVTARFADGSGDYQSGFMVVCGLIAIAMVCALSLRLGNRS
jgi:MFS family permease